MEILFLKNICVQLKCQFQNLISAMPTHNIIPPTYRPPHTRIKTHTHSDATCIRHTYTIFTHIHTDHKHTHTADTHVHTPHTYAHTATHLYYTLITHMQSDTYTHTFLNICTCQPKINKWKRFSRKFHYSIFFSTVCFNKNL